MEFDFVSTALVAICFIVFFAALKIGASEGFSFFKTWFFLVAALAVPMIAIEYPDLKREDQIRANLGSTMAAFVTKDCGKKGATGYGFEVIGRRYNGLSSTPANGGGCDDIKIGMPIKVFYDTTDPRNNVTYDPRKTPSSEQKILTTIMFVMAGSALVLIFAREFRL